MKKTFGLQGWYKIIQRFNPLTAGAEHIRPRRWANISPALGQRVCLPPIPVGGSKGGGGFAPSEKNHHFI